MTQETSNFNDNYWEKVLYLDDLVQQLDTMTNLLYYDRKNTKKLT